MMRPPLPSRELDRIDRWCDQCDELLCEIEHLFEPMERFPPWSAEQRATMSDLEAACFRSSKSVLLLVRAGELWDADILVRSVNEGSLKFIYLLSDWAAFADRYREYVSLLPEWGLLKNHAKAKAAFDVIVEPDRRARLSVIEGLILSETEEADIRQRMPKDIRAIDGRWGFTGLLAEIAKSNLPFAHRTKGELHNYSMQSRIAHADYIGIWMPRDEERLEDDERSELHLCHAARIINDVYVLGYTRLWVALYFLILGTEAADESWKKFEPLDQETKAVLSGYAAKVQQRRSSI